MSYESNIPDLCKALTDYASIKSLREPIEDILIDQANKLCCSNFGGLKGLYQEARDIGPTKDELLALPVQLNWHIKRESGPVFTEFEIHTLKRGKNKGQQRIRQKPGTQKGEIDKRIAHRGAMAVAWLSTRLNKYTPSSLAGVDKSGVQIESNGSRISVTIRNVAPQAGEVAARTGYIDRAIKNRIADLMTYVNSHLDKAAAQFNRR